MNGHEIEALLAAGTPLLDVRAPAEFARGAVPGAVNLPLLDDAERHHVGLAYKSNGHDAAVALGHELVSGEIRRQRESAWYAFAQSHRDAWICCWRGGQRSAIAQAWLSELGMDLPRVPGGFKALRQACRMVLDRAPTEKRWVVLGGRTGSGKTDLLRALGNALDLEGLARHRGSAFGAWEEPQPTPVSFENALATAFLQHRGNTLVLEDESRTIGRLALPRSWHAHMQTVPLAIVEVPMGQRIANITREYVTEPLAQGTPERTLYTRYCEALERIERRLGGTRRRAVQTSLDQGFASGDHHDWIRQLLSEYYDPMYDYQLEKKHARIAMQGCWETVKAFLSAY